jgi:hypothetical protein
MLKRHFTLTLTISGLALSMAAGALAMQMGRIDGFGPKIFNDPSLNHSLNVLAQKIAWLNSPDGNVFQAAQPAPENDNFDIVADLSSSTLAQGYFPNVRNDATLDRSNGILAQLIAWQNSPSGDAFMVAQAAPMVTGADFQRVAMASIPSGSQHEFE